MRSANRLAMRQWNERNPLHNAGRLRERRENPVVRESDKARRLARYASREDVRVKAKMTRDKYREHRAVATPAWADLSAIGDVYVKATALGHHVDHIIPLRGKTVCGLHVECNLQILPPDINRKKGARFDSAAIAA